MFENDRILANVKATMEMEGFVITEEQEKMGRDCLEGRVSFAEAVEKLKRKYMQKQVV